MFILLIINMNKIRFSQTQLDILATAEWNAETSLAEIAKLAKTKIHIVNYNLKNMEESGLIDWSPLIDMAKLGSYYFGFFFSVIESSKKRAELIAYISTHKNVAWFSELTGEFDFGIAILASSASEASKYFSEVISNYNLIKKETAIRLALWDFPRRYFSKLNIKQNPIKFGMSCKKIELSEREIAVLKSLRLKPFKSYRKLAQQINMSPSTYDSQLRKLRKKNILLKTHYNVDCSILGYDSYKLLVNAKIPLVNLEQDIINFSKKHPNVIHLVQAFGSWDYEINIEVKNQSELKNVIADFHQELSGKIFSLRTVGIVKIHALERALN